MWVKHYCIFETTQNELVDHTGNPYIAPVNGFPSVCVCVVGGGGRQAGITQGTPIAHLSMVSPRVGVGVGGGGAGGDYPRNPYSAPVNGFPQSGGGRAGGDYPRELASGTILVTDWIR